MKKTQTKVIVLDTDEGIVEWKKVEGWVGKDGRFYGDDKRLAIYANCTHKKCEKGHTYRNIYINCPDCRTKEIGDKFHQLESKEWDGETPLCIYDSDTFFFSVDDIEHYLEYNELFPDDLKLIICKPAYLDQVEESLWEEILPEDYSISDISEEVANKLQELNEVISKCRPASWWPTNTRTKYSRKN